VGVSGTATACAYQDAFELERQQVYPVVDAFEARMGYALAKDRYEAAARVLACPVKRNPPNWQHGRIVYAAVRRYLVLASSPVTLLDIGTAKGYSALCLQWALLDMGEGGIVGQVHSVDVIDPTVRAVRNTVAEVDGLKTLAETLAPWPEAQAISFECKTGLQWLSEHRTERVHVAFIDGKHTGPVVLSEGELLATMQQPGDLAIFDDVHLEEVGSAVRILGKHYDTEVIQVMPKRAYAVGVRR
jgi:predicted O-methyltransferase YrrM